MGKPPSEFLEFCRLFNGEHFFEAHEVLESLWRKTGAGDPERNFYQGLIQIAAALVHVQKGNLQGARELLLKAEKNLCSYLPVHQEAPLKLLLDESTESLKPEKIFPKINLL